LSLLSVQADNPLQLGFVAMEISLDIFDEGHSAASTVSLRSREALSKLALAIHDG
jgi:hypothetical protein